MLEKIKKISQEFFNKLNINYNDLKIIENTENIFLIKINSTDSWLLIWNHWKNFEAIQLLLSLIIKKQINENIKIHLEINDYIHNKDEKLFNFVKRKISLAKKLQKNIVLPFFNAFERKKIHSFVSDLNDKKIDTESFWEWKDRRIHIIYKNISSLEIDINWNDI